MSILPLFTSTVMLDSPDMVGLTKSIFTTVFAFLKLFIMIIPWQLWIIIGVSLLIKISFNRWISKKK